MEDDFIAMVLAYYTFQGILAYLASSYSYHTSKEIA